jgi:MOSC domain-containing protein YiiM
MTRARETITLRSVSVGQPAWLGKHRGQSITSGIRKSPVQIATVDVGRTNIAGDGQADLRVHGGPDKAIYCYPAEHLAWWRDEIGYAGDGIHAPFGENLSVLGVDEQTACIGDIWRWGDATLQVSQPRWPCFKLRMHTGVSSMIKRFVASGRSGWYLRVLEPGSAPASGEMTVIERDPEAIPVALAFAVRSNPETDPEVFARVMAHPALADGWRR